MNYQTACKNLDILGDEPITICILKKQYRLKALMYHPDKNKSENASQKFQEIHDSYEYLLNYLKFVDEDEPSCSDNDDSESEKSGYQWVLYQFLKNIIQDTQQTGILYKIIKNISNVCEDKAFHILEKIDKQLLMKICEIIQKYRQIFHFSIDFFDKVNELLANKMKNDECILLNPMMDDIFENNLYKLKVNGFLYIVPLWHHELVYDNSGNDVIVKMNPILPENVSIDEKNDIHIKLTYRIEELWDKHKIEFMIGKKVFSFSPQQMKLMRKQVFVLYKQGISKINTKNIYDISQKSDIIVQLEIIVE